MVGIVQLIGAIFAIGQLQFVHCAIDQLCAKLDGPIAQEAIKYFAPHHANTIKEADAFGQGAVHFTDVDGGLLRLPAPVHQVPHGTRWSFEFRGFHFWVSTFHVLGPESAPPPWTLLWRDPFGDRGRKACSDLREVYHHAAGLIARSQISSEGL